MDQSHRNANQTSRKDKAPADTHSGICRGSIPTYPLPLHGCPVSVGTSKCCPCQPQRPDMSEAPPGKRKMFPVINNLQLLLV